MSEEKKTNNVNKKKTGKNGFIKYKIPKFEIPKNENIFFCFMYNEKAGSIELNSIRQDSKILQHYQINDFPVEKCMHCKCDLTIDNLFFLDNDETFELYCGNCCQEKNSILKLSISESIYSQNNQLINKLNSYLEKNKNSSNARYIKIMESLISFTNIIAVLLALYNSKNAFQKQVLFLQSYIDNVSSYLEIVNNFNMDNLYLFLINFLVVSVDKIDECFLSGFFEHYFENINSFNTSEIQLKILRNIFNKCRNRTTMVFKTFEQAIENKKNILVKDFILINKDYSNLKFVYSEKKNSSLRKKIKIKELKNKIIGFLQNYNHSYNYISSKKVLERKFINEILFLLLKNNPQRFQKIKESESIINSILKELSNIIKFLESSKDQKEKDYSTVIELKKKIQEEINLFEKKKEKFYSSPKEKKKLPKEPAKKSTESIILTGEEKDILNKYLLSNSDESYTSIFASEYNNSDEIDYKKVQVILEFLFFIRDKTIDLIHLLNETALLFFEFLNQSFPNKKSINQGKNKIVEIESNEEDNEEDSEEDDNIEELKRDFNFSFQQETNNENIFKKLSAQYVDNIESDDAINYIFESSSNNDYSNEINYLYENVVIPERKEKIEKPNIIEEKSYHSLYQQKVDSLYNKLNDKFKNDPQYNSIIQYFSDLMKAKKKNKLISTPLAINFYQEHVDNFCDFKEMFLLKAEIEEYIKLIELEDNKLEKMQKVKERYKYIQKELKNFLKPNKENYSNYYKEWKEKNKKFVVEKYELNDLIIDLKKLIPKKVAFNVSGKDKKNFSLILYLFQKDHFLKDYV